ncbi:EAL domain-containing protein [Shinella sp. S4-D37]|uniref:putative bifunctional diguanylate cyclase/phosphodiesterase n=1 Tax=Shinella sp. S4-D37 TaxID=3161999 RepID=UPI00346732CD
MTVQDMFDRIVRTRAVPADNPDLLKAQYRAFSRQMPLMYLILLSSTWAVSTTHMAIAPLWLTVGIPAVLTLVCAVRVLHWWKSRHVEPTPETALHALKRVNYLAFGIAFAFTGWSFLLFPYGGAYTRSHLAFYMAITVISCIFSLMHLRSAALIVTTIVNGAFIFFFAATGQPTFIAASVNIALVSIGMLVILSINQRDFASMVNAQTEARRKNEEQSRLLRMIDDMPVAVMTADPETLNITYANETSKELIRKIEHLLPIEADKLVGTCIDVFHKNPHHQRRLLADPKNLPHSVRIKVGPEVLDLKVSPVMADDGSYIGPMLTWALVTREVEAESRIRQLAHYDALTGLPNRVTFREELAKGLATPGNRIGLLYLDLDGFKLINDTRGHPVGDILLGQVASRLRAICNGPAMTVGRLGGDEFAVLVPHNSAESAMTLAGKIIEALSEPYDLDHDRSIQLGASIGIALAPEHGESADALFARADLALYAAKAAGKAQAHIFLPAMETRVQERVRLEAKLRKALDTKSGLFVFYQPIVNIETGKVTAREALIRWHHPQRGWVSPGEFIPIAEQSSLIDQIGDFVLDQACRDAVGRKDGARVAVNISASQLGKGTLAQTVLSALVTSGLSPDRLEIEVTETALLGTEAFAMDDLRRLRDMGVRVALDDFGTGYSSLAHLRIFPFDKIKIDGSFVKEAVDRPESAAVVKAVADLGKRLGVTTVAEGVETQAQFDRIREEGCTEVQGYLCGRPAPNGRDAPIVERLNEAAKKVVAA